MAEQQFWKCTPKKLDALFEVHKKVNGLESEEDKAETIDNVIL